MWATWESSEQRRRGWRDSFDCLQSSAGWTKPRGRFRPRAAWVLEHAPLVIRHRPIKAPKPRLNPRWPRILHQQPPLALVEIQPPLETETQPFDIRRPPTCIGRHADQHARGRVLHVHHQHALAPNLEERRPGMARVQFKALVCLRGHKAERITVQQAVIGRSQLLVGPHLIARGLGPLHPHRADHRDAHRRSGQTVHLHSSPPAHRQKTQRHKRAQSLGRIRSWMKAVIARSAITSPSITRSPTYCSGSPFWRVRSAASRISCTMRWPVSAQSASDNAICRLRR